MNMLKNISTKTAPATLKTVWASAARLAWTPAPLAAMLAPIVVPIFSPRTMAAAIGYGNQPR